MAFRSRSTTAPTSRTQTFIEEHGSEGPLTGHETVEEWVGALAAPRVLMSMVQAGPATDAVIEEILPHLEPGDVLIDGGNANFRDTQRRHRRLAEQGIHFLGVGRLGWRGGCAQRPEHHARRRPRALRRVGQADLRGDRRRRSTGPPAAPTSGPTARATT